MIRLELYLLRSAPRRSLIFDGRATAAFVYSRAARFDDGHDFPAPLDALFFLNAAGDGSLYAHLRAAAPRVPLHTIVARHLATASISGGRASSPASYSTNAESRVSQMID